MQKTLLILLLLCPFLVEAQLNILFVDDSDDDFSNSENLQTAFTEAGVTFTLFDAQGTETKPDYNTLAQYDLVVWHTSTQGVDLYIWDGMDVDNEELKFYLNEGGNMWLIGNDFFYDRYLDFPVYFSAGDFAYDYLGVDSFYVESYTTDDGAGLPQADPAMDQPISGLTTLDWEFSTLWFADGVEPLADAVTIYEMGDENYVHAGATTGLWYDNGSSKVLTYFFDLSLVSTPELMRDNVSAVIDFFTAEVSTGVAEQNAPSRLEVFPNPVSDVIFIKDADLVGAYFKVMDAFGRTVQAGTLNDTQIRLSDYPTGNYILLLESEDGSSFRQMIQKIK